MYWIIKEFVTQQNRTDHTGKKDTLEVSFKKVTKRNPKN